MHFAVSVSSVSLVALALGGCFDPEQSAGETGGADSAASTGTEGDTSVTTTATATASASGPSTSDPSASTTMSSATTTAGPASDTDPSASASDSTGNDTATPAACGDGSVDAGEFCFGDEPTLVTAGNGAYDLAIADFDGVVGLDLLTLNRSASTVSLILNDGVGGFGNPASVTIGDGSCRVRATDGDGDGDIDAVVSGDPIVTLDNDGSGDLSRVDAPFGAGTFGGCGDYNDLDTLNNGGGAMDIVYSGEYNNSFVAGITNGSGWTFANNATGIGGPGEGSAGVTVTEVAYDADAVPDVVVVNRYYTTGQIFRGNGSGGFVEDGEFEVCGAVDPKVYLGARYAAAGDLDGNGQIDIVATCIAGSDPAGGFTYALGNDDGTFATAVPILLPGVQRVLLADVDADGDVDIVAPSTAELAVQVLLNDGAAVFDDPVNLPVGELVYNVEVADLDGDGAVDIAAPYAGVQGGRVAVFFADP
ncbi:MAG: VCBS repeat-containing protein [Deltaproteobacteria bacterium]|nr:VCBS repeat-containing protein [Deltaproteobacteria bacterium]MBK8714234.1 VCBS repeat-containing protein [Deltaproteobacteria bacterium]